MKTYRLTKKDIKELNKQTINQMIKELERREKTIRRQDISKEDNIMTRLYIASSPQHCDVSIYADSERDCENAFAEMLGYKDYEDMKSQLGDEISKVDSQLMWESEINLNEK